MHLGELPAREDLTLVLAVASVTPTLLNEITRVGWTLTPLGRGYARIDGVMYTAYVVIIDEVTEAERDEYLRLFSHLQMKQGETTRWMRDTKMKQPNIEELPGFEELFQKTVERTLEAMPLEQRLAGLSPEQRLAGLSPEQVHLALPLEVLRVLPEEYLRSLPVELQEQIRKRLQGAAH